MATTSKSFELTRHKKRVSQNSQPTNKDTSQPPLYDKFVKLLNKKKERSLLQGIYNYYGKNFPIDYQDRFKFN